MQINPNSRVKYLFSLTEDKLPYPLDLGVYIITQDTKFLLHHHETLDKCLKSRSKFSFIPIDLINNPNPFKI